MAVVTFDEFLPPEEKKKENSQNSGAISFDEFVEPTVARELGIAARGAAEGVPGALGGAGGAYLGGTLGLLGGPLAPVTVPLGALALGVAGSMGADYLFADKAKMLADKYLPKAASEPERLLEAGAKTAVEVGTPIGFGKYLMKKGTQKVAEFMAAQPLTQLAAGEFGAAGTELSDNQGVGFGASLIPTALAAIKGRVQFPKAAAAKTLDEIKTAATAAYDKAKNAGVVVNQAATTDLANKLRTTMANFGFDEDAHDIIKPIVKMINKRSGQDLSLSQLDTFRRALNTRVKKAFSADGGADDARIGSAVVQKLDDFINELDNSQLSKGNTRVALPALEEARKLWRQKTKMETVSDILGEADRTGDRKKIERGFTRIAKNENLFNKFSLDEQRIIGKIVKGDALDLIKDAAPGVTPSGISKGAVWSLLGYFNPVLAGAGAAGSAALKFVTRNSDKNQAEALSELISRGYAPPKFNYSEAIAPLVGAGARGAMAPDEQPEQKAVGGLASLKKRYG